MSRFETSKCQCGCGGIPEVATETNEAFGWVKGESFAYCPGHSHGGLLKLKASPSNGSRWKSGRYISKKTGYAFVFRPESPMAQHTGYVLEHRLVAAEMLNMDTLPAEWVVHHVNSIRHDNRLENLQVFTSNALHMKWHRLLDKHLSCSHLDGDSSTTAKVPS